MQFQWRRIGRNALLSLCSTMLLAACGGGGGSASSGTVETQPVVAAEVAAGAKSLAVAVVTAPETTIAQGAEGGLILTSDSAKLQEYSQGEVVFLPEAPDQGVPFPFVGKVASIVTADGKTEMKLLPANVEDAYSSLKWDIDTALTGATVVGVIAPRNARVNFSSRPAPVNQTGLAITDKLTLDGNALSGTIGLEQDFFPDKTDKDTVVSG